MEDKPGWHCMWEWHFVDIYCVDERTNVHCSQLDLWLSDTARPLFDCAMFIRQRLRRVEDFTWITNVRKSGVDVGEAGSPISAALQEGGWSSCCSDQSGSVSMRIKFSTYLKPVSTLLARPTERPPESSICLHSNWCSRMLLVSVLWFTIHVSSVKFISDHSCILQISCELMALILSAQSATQRDKKCFDGVFRAYISSAPIEYNIHS